MLIVDLRIMKIGGSSDLCLQKSGFQPLPQDFQNSLPLIGLKMKVHNGMFSAYLHYFYISRLLKAGCNQTPDIFNL